MKTEAKTVYMIITAALMLLPLVYGLIRWNALPEQVAIHFALNGTPNGWAPRAVMVFVIPAAGILLQVILFAALSSAGPQLPAALYYAIMTLTPVVILFVCFMIYGKALK